MSPLAMSPRDLALTLAVILAFAILLTAHLAIAAGLLGRAPRWRALVALLVPPFAPYFALRARMRARGLTWLVALVAYAVARGLALGAS